MGSFRTWHIEMRDIDDLIPHPNNPRYLTKHELSHLKKSISRFGLIDLPIINYSGQVIGGHQRIEILKNMGMTEIQCWVPDGEDLTQEEINELNIRLNKNQGSWDWDMLANTWDIQDLLDWGFEDDDFEDSVAKNKKPQVIYEFEDPDELKSFMSSVESIEFQGNFKTKVKI